MRKFNNLLVCAALLFTMTCPAYAAQQPQITPAEAGAALRELGIYQGDHSGDLMLDKGLTRAELAVILARLNDDNGEFASYPDGFAYLCSFSDVPDWAKSAVGYCWNRGLVKGYGNSLYGSGDPVAPAAACTVVLRTYGYRDTEGADWDYSSAGTYAVRLGLIGESAIQGPEITRGDMAVLIYQAMNQKADIPAPVPSVPEEDHSLQANPAIFQGGLNREVYNAVRDTISHREDILARVRVPMTIPWSQEAKTTMDTVTAAMGAAPVYSVVHTDDGQLACSAKYTAAYQEALIHTQPFIDSLSGLNDKEKVRALAWYVCDRLDYSYDIIAPSVVLSSDGVSRGNCMAYAHSFAFLCGRAGIPCLIQHSEDHQWNKVYADGAWWDIDLTGSDPPDLRLRELTQLLYRPGELQGIDHLNIAPEITLFVQELLVPGSTI